MPAAQTRRPFTAADIPSGFHFTLISHDGSMIASQESYGNVVVDDMRGYKREGRRYMGWDGVEQGELRKAA